MQLFKWIEGLKPKFPNFIENLFGEKISDKAKDGESISSVPAVNVDSQKEKYEIEVALPGLDKDDIDIEVNDGVLSITSEKQYSSEDRNKNFIRQEFGYASFQRSFALPDGFCEDEINAKLDKGILKIEVPYRKQLKNDVKQIKIN